MTETLTVAAHQERFAAAHEAVKAFISRLRRGDVLPIPDDYSQADRAQAISDLLEGLTDPGKAVLRSPLTNDETGAIITQDINPLVRASIVDPNAVSEPIGMEGDSVVNRMPTDYRQVFVDDVIGPDGPRIRSDLVVSLIQPPAVATGPSAFSASA